MTQPSPRQAGSTYSTRAIGRTPEPDLSQRVRETIAAALANLARTPAGDEPALTVERAAVPIAPAQLAAAHPGGAREKREAQTTYARFLHHYRTVVRAGDLPLGADDVGAALAHFVAANIDALHGERATPEMMLKLERQLVGIVRAAPAWSRASSRDRQGYVEQLAILSVMMAHYAALARREGPAGIANVQRGARGYLWQLIGIDPDALGLGPDGLTMRAAAAAAA